MKPEPQISAVSAPEETVAETETDDGFEALAFRDPVRSFRGSSEERFSPGVVLAERYRIVCLLGRGGMSEVYRADDLDLEQPVAPQVSAQDTAAEFQVATALDS